MMSKFEHTVLCTKSKLLKTPLCSGSRMDECATHTDVPSLARMSSSIMFLYKFDYQKIGAQPLKLT